MDRIASSSLGAKNTKPSMNSLSSSYGFESVVGAGNRSAALLNLLESSSSDISRSGCLELDTPSALSTVLLQLRFKTFGSSSSKADPSSKADQDRSVKQSEFKEVLDGLDDMYPVLPRLLSFPNLSGSIVGKVGISEIVPALELHAGMSLSVTSELYTF